LEEDCRAISLDLLEKLQNGGFAEFVNFVRKTEKEDLEYKLALCFRGNNNPESVVIYYHNNMVWKLNVARNKKLKVTISFNHARYTENWKEKLEILHEKYNFAQNKNLEDIIKRKKDNNEIEIGYLTAQSDSFDKNFVEGTFNDVLKPIINDFFNPDLKFDYFKNKDENHRVYLEKTKQQELYLKFNNTKNGLLIYDLEFAQKRVKNVEENKNQPDMLGVKYKNEKIEKLVFVEVKSTESAVIEKKSGLIKHIDGMETYLKDKNAINNRMIEANKILNNYKDLKLRNIKNVQSFSNLPIEIRVILTNDAIEYFKRNKSYYENRKNGDSKNLSKILTSRNYKIDYFNDRIEIYK
jgi:hypothetical protein